MFDWPEHTHTSPTSTSLNVSVFFPATVISIGAPASIASSVTRHLPCASATAAASRPPAFTATASPGSAVPQTGTFVPRWSTM
jgi:hypothetical protein